jgi:hypothetical protein
MIRRMSGMALVVLSDVMLIVALTADSLGLGVNQPAIIGYKQVSLAVAAIVVQLAGLVLSQVEIKGKSF